MKLITKNNNVVRLLSSYYGKEISTLTNDELQMLMSKISVSDDEVIYDAIIREISKRPKMTKRYSSTQSYRSYIRPTFKDYYMRTRSSRIDPHAFEDRVRWHDVQRRWVLTRRALAGYIE